MSETTYYIPRPDSKIFKHKSAVETILEENQTTYLIDRISYDNGYPEVYYIGADYPKKGFPTPEALTHCGIAKRLLMKWITLPLPILLFRAKQTLQDFNEVAFKAMGEYLLEYNCLTPTAQAVGNILEEVLVALKIPNPIAADTAEIIANMIDYDDAYRYRIQDVVSEHYNLLMISPIVGLKEVLKTLEERDNPEVYAKFKRFIKPLISILHISYFNLKLREILQQSDQLKKMCYDDSDYYWVCMRDGYKFLGKTYEERQTLIVNKPQGYKIKQ